VKLRYLDEAFTLGRVSVSEHLELQQRAWRTAADVNIISFCGHTLQSIRAGGFMEEFSMIYSRAERWFEWHYGLVRV